MNLDRGRVFLDIGLEMDDDTEGVIVLKTKCLVIFLIEYTIIIIFCILF